MLDFLSAGFRHPLRLIIPLVIAITGLVACARSPEIVIPTPAPTAQVSLALPTSATATDLPPPTSTLVPTPTLHPTPTPCQFPIQPDLAEFWSASLLGCPITPGEAAISTAYAPFEGGQMLWRGDTDTIYVLTHDGRWRSYPNEWREGDPEFTCGEDDPTAAPIRGFGRVWCDHPDVREALGAPTAEEIGDSASAVQDFGNGTILVAPFGGVFVFVNEDSTWRRIDE